MAESHSTVTFRDIPEFPGYRAGSDGSIWSCWRFRGDGFAGKCRQVMSDRWRQLKPDRRPIDGRKRYTLRCVDRRYVRKYGSHFVLMAFVGPRPEGMECCHGDGDCTNDSANNLRWDTPLENKADMQRHGTRVKGEQINTAKLTEDDVRIIRTIGYPIKQHAIRFGVTEALVSTILTRKIWKHVE